MINKRLVHLVDRSMCTVWCNVAVLWAGLCCNVATIMAIGWLLESLLDGNYTPGRLAACTGVAAASIAIRFGCSMISSQLGYVASERVKLTLRQKIYAKLLRLGPAYHRQVSTSEAVQVAVEGVDQLEIYFGKYLPQLFYSLLAPLTLFAVLAFINLPSALVLLACVPLIPGSIIAVQKFAKKLLAKYWSKYTNLGDGFLENLQSLTTLKIYGSDEAKNQEMNRRAEDFRRVTMRVLIMQLNSVTLMDIIAYGGAALGIIVSVNQLLAGRLDFFGCFVIILLAADFFIPLRLLGSFFHIAMNGMAASEKIFNILDLPETNQGTVTELDASRGLELAGVSFSYDGQRSVLKDIDLRAGAGITAIVGGSGCGKSTIAALLCGQDPGYQGRVVVGGVEINALNPEALSRAVTLVPHNAYLFKGTVRQNLLMAKPGASDEQLWAALQKVRLDEFLSCQQGLDTLLAERGSNLSGGQCQRLALARALLHESPIYIFDEATSNIDAESENDIVKVIWEMGRTTTVLLISHRLANVVQASNIYVMEQGVISEQGQHEVLLAQSGLYARMFHAQRQLEHAGRKEADHA